MAYIRETEEFDQETLQWQTLRRSDRACSHIFAMAKQGERDPHRLIDGALMRLTL
jgi:hypothetical protein